MTTGRLRSSSSTTARPASEPSTNRLAGLLGGGREHVEVTIPRTTIKGLMRLLSRSERSEVHASARAFMLASLQTSDPNALLTPMSIAEWNAEVAIRTLAVAVRAPEDKLEALDSADTWRDALDDDQVAALYDQYKDLADRLDPIGDDAAPLSEPELAQLDAAVKKKDAAILMSFGSRRLASYMLTLAAPPAT